MTDYLTIAPPDKSRAKEVTEICNVLNRLPLLKQVTKTTYEIQAAGGNVHFCIVMTDENGNYSASEDILIANSIQITAHDQPFPNPIVEEIVSAVASELGWQWEYD